MGLLSRSLFTHLIAAGTLKGWCAVRTLHIAIAVAIRFLDRRWHSQRLVRSAHPTYSYRGRYSLALSKAA